jgi:phosphoribosylglycinamide formyltransferase-1
MGNKVRTALIASGSGTDAYAIMSAYNNGQIPNIDLQLLISTKIGAGCLEKANECKIETLIISQKELNPISKFNNAVTSALIINNIKLVFLVGCIAKIAPVKGIIFYNIHPANIEKYGGKTMYGVEPHRKVLSDIADLIRRDRKTIDDKFYTEPTVHEVEKKYDSGQCLLKISVKIPKRIIIYFMNSKNLENENHIAALLQQHVLPYEWMILPPAVKIAATKIIEKEKMQ